MATVFPIQRMEMVTEGYTLTLSVEEATLLGTLRFFHIAADCPLWPVLKDLPADGGKYFPHRVDGNVAVLVRAPVEYSEQVRAQPKARTTSKLKRWSIQFKPKHTQWWTTVISVGPFASRNNAYRKMEPRKKLWAQHYDYRVVPEGTPDGPEKDRGVYRVQYWSSQAKCWKNSESLWEVFLTAEAAKKAIKVMQENFGTDPTYRVKWEPTK